MAKELKDCGRRFQTKMDRRWTREISILGIQFGNAGNDISQDFLSQLNGKHYDGTNAEELIQAFKDIFGN
jgi:hypothetical protein